MYVLKKFNTLCLILFIMMISTISNSSAQIYMPAMPFWLWDTWVFQDGNDYHLFYLQSEPDSLWNTIGRAVSKDLVHWTPIPPIHSRGHAGDWDGGATLTGCTVKYNGKYVLFYATTTPKATQKIGIMSSSDLMNWEKDPRNPILGIQVPFYSGEAWRDISLTYDSKEKLWHGYVCAQTGLTENLIIKDKTLVAWVYLADIEQRGGSILALKQCAVELEKFDAIVYGEKEPGKWMAGSENSKRTYLDQSSYPFETSEAETLVQIAIVYSGDRVKLFRNGEQFDSYSISNPMIFGSGSFVTMGVRHTSRDDDGTFFAGALEEARIYDVALDVESIRALSYSKPSDIKPIAQWTFEDGTATDAICNFSAGLLHGGAYIKDGKLILDGKDDCMITPYYGPTACIAHLTSRDLAEWEYLKPVFSSNEFFEMEVPDYFEINGFYYLLFSTVRSHKNTSGRKNASGTFYVMADKRLGPYHLPRNALLLGSGRWRFDNYVGRTIKFGDKLLLYHQAVGGTSWATPKTISQNEDGTLWLEYWSGLEKLETRILFDSVRGLLSDERTGPGEWEVKGNTLNGHVQGDQSVLWLPITAGDANIVFNVTSSEAKNVGLIWRWNGKNGICAVVNHAAGAVTVVRADALGNDLNLSVIDSIEEVKLNKKTQQIRAFIRDCRAEIYLNDRWLFNFAMNDITDSGKIGFYIENGSAQFSELHGAELEPLVPIDQQLLEAKGMK